MRRKNCPFCKPNRIEQPDPIRESQCILNKPLMMVIPPDGVHLSCPVHPEGHHIFGPSQVWCEQKPIVHYGRSLDHNPSWPDNVPKISC